MPRETVWKKHYALPSEHGLWTWWLVPLLIGLAAANGGGPEIVLLCLAALTSFLMHQPAVIAVKAWSGRRPRSDLAPALCWVAGYGLVSAAAVGLLLSLGHWRIATLIAPGLVFFLFHLWLVSRKAERRQKLVEIVGAATLALWAPAAFWVCGGQNYPEPWVLLSLSWLHTASAIVNVYLRLEQIRWPATPPASARLLAGAETLVWNLAGLLVAIGFATAGLAPWLVILAFAIVLADVIVAVWRPMVGGRPNQVGLRQLLSTCLFVIVMITAYLVR